MISIRPFTDNLSWMPVKIPSSSEVTKMVVEVESWSHGCNHFNKQPETPDLPQKVQNTVEDLILLYFEGLFKFCAKNQISV